MLRSSAPHTSAASPHATHGWLPLAALVVLAAAITGCNTLATPLRGEVSALHPEEAAASVDVGARVRWGGVLIVTEPQQERTCFEVLSLRLTAEGRARRDPDEAHGRVVACRSGFYDPALFAEGREVTFMGRIDGVEMRKVGDYDARAPRIEADVVMLWPRRSAVEVVRVPATPWPWWGWW